VIEEATTLSLAKYKTLRDSKPYQQAELAAEDLRYDQPGQHRSRLVQAAVHLPARKLQETDTRFIFATVDDNKFVDPDTRRSSKTIPVEVARLPLRRLGHRGPPVFLDWNYDEARVRAVRHSRPLAVWAHSITASLTRRRSIC